MEAPTLERVTSYLSTTSYLSVDEPKDKEGGEASGKTKKEKEPTSFALPNPSRLVPAQVPLISLSLTSSTSLPQTQPSAQSQPLSQPQSQPQPQRYTPISLTTSRKPIGIIMLRDQAPGEKDLNVVKVTRVALGQEDEAPPPAPFEWNPNE